MSTFQKWLHEQDAKRDWDNMTPTQQMRVAWNAAKKESERENAALNHALNIAQTELRLNGCAKAADEVAKLHDAARKEAQP